jgi:type I restriction enzyme S subunit
MTSPPDRRPNSPFRTYNRANSIVFLKTREEFGGLSNMAGGFPLEVNGIRILTSEALYQACRFPHRPNVQRLIIEQASPMTAKMKGKPYRHDSRPDWDQVRVKVMRWCLRVKLAQNWAQFSELLMSTRDRPIVEESRKDDFWGAKPIDDQTLVGMNVLGRLLMELREEVRSGNGAALLRVDPLTIPDFLLSGKQIESVVAYGATEIDQALTRLERTTPAAERRSVAGQASLFSHHPRIERVKHEELADTDSHELIRDIGPYPAYKDSGVPSLGKVPDHWQVRRQRNILQMLVSTIDKHSVERELPVRLCNYVDVYKNERITGSIPFMHATAAEEELERFRLQAGDVIITKDSESWNDIGVPAFVEYAAADLVCGYHLAILRPREEILTGRYLLRALQSQGVAFQYHVSANGVTRYGLSQDSIKSILLPVPPLSEQSLIVRFLDHMDRRIRRYIRAKQKLIALLNEQKQVIIHHAVTRGLDPNIRLKPSGVEWLGDVPHHWQVRKLHQITDPNRAIMYGIVLPGPHVENGVYIVKGGNCEPGRLRPELLSRTTYEIEAAYVRSRLRKDDIVFAIRGGVGAAELVPAELENANLTQDAARIAPGPRINARWLLRVVQAPIFQEHAKARVVGATVRGINIRDLKRINVVVPPLNEQSAIAACLDQGLADIERAITRANSEIDLLREYRTRLIADVVTGKLDMREAAARLPQDIEEPEALEDADTQTEDDAITDADLEAVSEEVDG